MLLCSPLKSQLLDVVDAVLVECCQVGWNTEITSQSGCSGHFSLFLTLGFTWGFLYIITLVFSAAC